MGRRKLTDEEKRIKNEEKEMKDFLHRYKFDLEEKREKYINKPTIFYEIGEKVKWGNHTESYIEFVFDCGKFYFIHSFGMYKEYSNMVYRENYHFIDWHDLDKYTTKEDQEKIPRLERNEDIRLNYSQTSLSDVFGKVYYFGLDLEPEYQRGHVWELEDKVKLINSIFLNIDIGKFVYVRLPFKNKSKGYEILDGKQRVTAIIEFYENRFQYKGMYYKDLHWRDKNHFRYYNISYALIEKPTKEQIYKYFLYLNVGGKPVDEKHIDYVRGLLKKVKDEI